MLDPRPRGRVSIMRWDEGRGAHGPASRRCDIADEAGPVFDEHLVGDWDGQMAGPISSDLRPAL